MPDGQGVLILGERVDGKLDPVSTELLGHGRKLADALGEPLSIAILGQDLDAICQEAIAFGADKAYAVTDPLLKEFQVDAFLAALAQLCQAHPARIILAAKTPVGSEVTPRLAFRLGTGLLQDCLEVRVDASSKGLVANRPVYGGNCVATVVSATYPMMAIIRPKTGDPLARDGARRGEVEAFTPRLEPSVVKSKTLQRTLQVQEGIRLEEASIVVSGGRGLGGPDPFYNELKELAKLLGAAQGASRAAVDAGWVPHSYQVGLTGVTIAPNVYITVGISGASQHMAGCSGSKFIVAINRDKEATIFKEARYGVVGDWKKVLPAFIEQIREIK